jgi:hypothetical protein
MADRHEFSSLAEWVSVHDGAIFLGVSNWLLYKGIREGTVPARRFGAKRIFIPKAFFDPTRTLTDATAVS